VKTRRILLIELENSLRELTQLCLETVAQWEVVTTVSLSEAVVRSENEPFDTILVDMDILPSEKDLAAILQNLQNNPTTASIPIILLTSSLPATELLKFQQLGVKTCIVKPFDLVILANKVATALNWERV
jgi:CheY-like chemotaxis protein